MTRKSQRLYNIYNGIKYRAVHNNIQIDTSWKSNYDNFKAWAINNQYDDNKKLFLVDIKNGYFPSNCVWATHPKEVRITKIKEKKKCLLCETLITNKTKHKYCRVCAGLQRRKNVNFDRGMYARNWSLNKKYGISLNDFNFMYTTQKGLCAICGKHMKLPTKTRGQDLDVVAIDHCHKTEKVRSLLCNACNKGLGLFLDNQILLENAKNYLKEHHGT